MKYTGAEIIVKSLENLGIKTVAGIPGGSNLPLYDALFKSGIRHILARHEQGAGFIAQGMARTSGRTAVCFATSGPGATNLLTAVADARLDSVPLVAITGQVPLAMLGTDAFQEVDTHGLCIPITKHTFLVESAEELARVIPEAFRIAERGRPGPVVIDVPKDVQLQKADVEIWPERELPEKPASPDAETLSRISAMIDASKRPVLYIGGGITSSDANGYLTELAERNSIPVASTLTALGCIRSDHPLSLGMLGMHGERSTNLILNEADLLIAVGVRFDDRATGRLSGFCPNASLIHIDIDRAEIDKIRQTEISLEADAAEAVRGLIPLLAKRERIEWMRLVSELRKSHPPLDFKDNSFIHPANLIKMIGRLVPEDAIVSTDVGQHQMWTAQHFPFKRPRTLLTSSGLGTMGFGLPAAIGAALENPDRLSLCISGDGSLLMNIQELATLADLKLNVKIVLINNNCLGLVRQQQKLFFKGNYSASSFDSSPNFAAIAAGFGINAIRINLGHSFEDQLNSSLSSEGPILIEIPTDPDALVLPMVPPGEDNTTMIGGEYYE